MSSQQSEQLSTLLYVHVLSCTSCGQSLAFLCYRHFQRLDMFPIKNYQGSKIQCTFTEQSSLASILNEHIWGCFVLGCQALGSLSEMLALPTKGGLPTTVSAQCLWKTYLKGDSKQQKIRNSFWNMQAFKAAEAVLQLTRQCATLQVKPSPAAAFKIRVDYWTILFISISASATFVQVLLLFCCSSTYSHMVS